MAIDRRKYLYRIKRLEIKSWMKYLMIQGKSVIDYVLGELMTGTDITINNTVEKTFYKFDIKGNSIQDGTPSPTNEVPILSSGDDIQLFDKNSNFYKRFSNSTYTVSGNDIHFKSITANANEFFWVNIPVTIGKDITISYGNIEEAVANQNNKMQFFFSSTAITTYSNSWSLTDISKTDKYITATATAQYLVVIFRTGNVQEYTISNVKVQQGSIVTPYSPYNMGSISEKIVNKNWFNKDTTTSQVGYFTASGELKSGGSSTVTTSYTQILPNTNMYLSGVSLENVCYYDENFNFIERVTTVSTRINKNAKYIRFQTATSNFNLDNVQLELGTSATTYVAHQEQTYTIPCQQPMRSIGTVRDEFIKVNGEWKERHNIGRKIYDGREDEGWYINAYTYRAPNFDGKPFSSFDTNNPLAKSNYFKWQNGSSGVFIEGSMWYILAGNQLVVQKDNNPSSTTLADFKTWLSTHNLEVIYQLATPQDLPCTEEQIAILENLPKSYNEQTNIYSLDVTPAYLEVQAYVKKEEVIEND